MISVGKAFELCLLKRSAST